jgi:hypothetical protein
MNLRNGDVHASGILRLEPDVLVDVVLFLSDEEDLEDAIARRFGF